MTSAAVIGEYVICARVLARDFADPKARGAARNQARSLAQVLDSEAGFFKARTASYLKALILNAEQVPANGGDDFKALLLHGANLLLMLPDDPIGGRSPRRLERRSDDAPPRYVPGRDD
jgi:hypothetical protein